MHSLQPEPGGTQSQDELVGAARSAGPGDAMASVLALQAAIGNRNTARLLSDRSRRSGAGATRAAVLARQLRHYRHGERQWSQSGAGVAVQSRPGPLLPDNLYLVDFTPGSATLRPEHVRLLSELLTHQHLAAHAARVSIIGYTDAVDDESTNAPLREQRAEAVRDYLARHGVPAEVLHAAGARPGERLSEDSTVGGRATNRAAVVHMQSAPDRTEPQPPRPRCPHDGGIRAALDLIGATAWAHTTPGRGALGALEQSYAARHLNFDPAVHDPHAADSFDPHDAAIYPYGGPPARMVGFRARFMDPEVRINPRHRCDVLHLAVYLAHEGVHLHRRGEPYIHEEVHGIIAERDVYAELLDGVDVGGRRVVIPHDPFLDLVISESRQNRTIDIAIRQGYPYDANWVARSLHWWGGPPNRWLTTLESYLVTLFDDHAPLSEYIHAERIVEILEAVPDNTVGPPTMVSTRPFTHLIGRVGLQRLRERLTPLYQSNRTRTRLEAVERRTGVVLHLR
jgi:outer membrane protein OmpA-like peptidoglycan-associated protein